LKAAGVTMCLDKIEGSTAPGGGKKMSDRGACRLFGEALMSSTQSTQYRGYEIVPQRQWSSWCARIYPTRADLPIWTGSALETLATRKADAISEAKLSIDSILLRLGKPQG
jgi:hypothetical protein